MDKPIQFRTKMRGYNKDDVNKFISEENIRFNKLEESYIKTIKEKEKEIEELYARLDQEKGLEQRLAECEADLAELNSKLDAQCSVIEEKDAIIDGLKTAVDSTNERLAIANTIIDELRAKAESAPAVTDPVDAEFIDKAEKYDAIYDKVDEILNFAQEEANKIIADAIELKKQAVKQSPAKVKQDISQRSDSIIEELKKTIRRSFKPQK